MGRKAGSTETGSAGEVAVAGIRFIRCGVNSMHEMRVSFSAPYGTHGL